MIDRNKLIDLLLRIYFVNNSPDVGGAFVMAWAHGMEYNPGLTYHEQFSDMCEILGLPRELPKPEYPKRIWAAFRLKKGYNPYNDEDCTFEEVFSGLSKEVHEWTKKHEGEYHHIGSTNRTFETEEQTFEKWKKNIIRNIK